MIERRRPLTARSVVASTLLGTDPPVLPVASLVRTGALFGLAEGTVRTALSRMVAAGEARTDGTGRYELTGPLVERKARQRTGRAAATRAWDGDWLAAVVVSGARDATARAELRELMRRRRFGELRDGVWTRPNNLDLAPDPHDGSCDWFSVRPGAAPGTPIADGDDDGDADAAELAATLWDLAGWSADAKRLRAEMDELVGRLEDGDEAALAEGFVVSAAVLRHLGTDPLLPPELLPPDWPGALLRREYDRYDAAYRRGLAGWVRAGR